MSVQATVLNLLLDLRQGFGLTYLFISHDLSVVERLSDRVAIMHRGEIVETNRTAEVFARPAHPYTQALLAAAPRLDRRLEKRPVALAKAAMGRAGKRRPRFAQWLAGRRHETL